MGLSIWPRYPFVLLLLSLCSPTLAYQIVPDDIAFKPAAQPNSSEATPEPVLSDSASTDTQSATAAETPLVNSSPMNPASEGLAIDTQELTPPPIQSKPISSQCKINGQWKKTLTITAMPRLIPHQSNAGNFYQAETHVPKMLATELGKRIGIESHLVSQTFSTLEEEKKRRLTQSIATQQGTQFVLHGEILDMSMRDTASVYSPGFVQSLRNHFTDLTMMRFTDNRTRIFSLHLELRDGFTGELLMAESFHTNGIWKNPNPVGFNTETIHQSQYGRRIKQLIQKAGNKIAKNLECQPYMARVDVFPGQTELLLQGGANNGLHPGDALKLYQLVVIASPTQYDSYHTRLIKRDLQLQLKEVYPSHSLAQLNGDDLLNGQYLAVGEE
jgi:hypothetical protein